MEEITLRVSSSTPVKQLASSIQKSRQDHAHSTLILRCIGAGAINQAIKAVVNSNKEFSSKGFLHTILPCYKDIEHEGVTLTSLELQLKVVRV